MSWCFSCGARNCALRRGCSVATLWLSASCEGGQSTLDPAGDSARLIADFFWQMTAGATVIWLAFVALTLYAFYRRSEPTRAYARVLIVGGGVALPTIVLAGVLAYGLAMLPTLLAAAPEGSLRVEVIGEQYWWRVRYADPNGQPIDLANELHLPVRRPVELQLQSADVVHSFWIPALAGKVDMFPGRATRLRVVPTRTGAFRGVCAEFCGASHALMAMRVRVAEPRAFAQWLEAQAQPAGAAPTQLAAEGGEIFASSGCGACHSVRGTAAHGAIGPDLTHVGSRRTLGAGSYPNTVEAFERWIRDTDRLKPGAVMPHFGMLPAQHVRALAAYLEGLQ